MRRGALSTQRESDEDNYSDGGDSVESAEIGALKIEAKKGKEKKEVKGTEDAIKIKKKKTRVKLTEDKLCRDDGVWELLRKMKETLKGKTENESGKLMKNTVEGKKENDNYGKSESKPRRLTEAQEIKRIIDVYREWSFNQAPYLTFDTFIQKTEKLSSKPGIRSTLELLRDKEAQSVMGFTVVWNNNDDIVTTTKKVEAESSSKIDSDLEDVDFFSNSPAKPKAKIISDEQKARMEKAKSEALLKRQQRIEKERIEKENAEKEKQSLIDNGVFDFDDDDDEDMLMFANTMEQQFIQSQSQSVNVKPIAIEKVQEEEGDVKNKKEEGEENVINIVESEVVTEGNNEMEIDEREQTVVVENEEIAIENEKGELGEKVVVERKDIEIDDYNHDEDGKDNDKMEIDENQNPSLVAQ